MECKLDHDTVAHCMRLKGIVVGAKFIEYKRLPERIKDYALHRPGVGAVRVNGHRVNFVWEKYEEPHHVDEACFNNRMCVWKKTKKKRKKG